MLLLRTREAREDNPCVVLAPGGRVDCRSPTEKARRAVIPEREATLSTPKMNQLTRLGIDFPRGGRALGAERMIAAVSKLDDRARTRGRRVHNR